MAIMENDSRVWIARHSLAVEEPTIIRHAPEPGGLVRKMNANPKRGVFRRGAGTGMDPRRDEDRGSSAKKERSEASRVRWRRKASDLSFGGWP